MRKSTQGLAGRFQRRQRLRLGDTRKRIEKLVEPVVSFEVVDQVTERNTGSDNHRRAAQNIRIAVDDWSGDWRGHIGSCSNRVQLTVRIET